MDLMSRSLHVPLDDSSAAALQICGRRRARSSIAAEVERLAADEADRSEMRIIREQMAELARDPVG
jgi:hypothetical protein